MLTKSLFSPDTDSLILVGKMLRSGCAIVVALDGSSSCSVEVLGAADRRKVRVQTRNLGNLKIEHDKE
jgi:hypothetical protein